MIKRNYLERFDLSGVPVTDSLNYVKRMLKKFRKEHDDFEYWLQGLKKHLEGKYKMIDEVIDYSFPFSDYVLGSKSIFNLLVKFYNYHFDMEDTETYLFMCETIFKRAFSENLELTEIYFEEDNLIGFRYNIIKTNKEKVKTYYDYSIYFETSVDGEIRYSCSTNNEVYEDSWSLFAEYGEDSQKLFRLFLSKAHEEYSFVLKNEKRLKELKSQRRKLSIVDFQKVGLTLDESVKIIRLLK